MHVVNQFLKEGIVKRRLVVVIIIIDVEFL